MAALQRLQLAFHQFHAAFAAGAVAGAGGIDGHVTTPGQLQQIIAQITLQHDRGCPLNLEGYFHNSEIPFGFSML